MCLGLIGVVTGVDEVEGMPTAAVDLGTRTVEAPVLIGDPLGAGDYVIVHSGFVVELLAPEIAAEMLAARREMVDGG